MESRTHDIASLAELLLEEFTHRINNDLAALIAVVLPFIAAAVD